MKRRHAFTEATIHDAKRVVRGEQWSYARTYLRSKGSVRCTAMVLAGPAPSEEIQCLRSLWPSGRIVAVDVDETSLTLASKAGADDVVRADVHAWNKVRVKNKQWYSNEYSMRYEPPDGLDVKSFDVVCLDLCGPADDRLHATVRRFTSYMRSRTVLIVTFSYGRDLAEVYLDAMHERGPGSARDAQAQRLIDRGLSEAVASRLSYLFGGIRVADVRSVITYRGGAMPMVSSLLVREPGPRVEDDVCRSPILDPVSIVQIEDEDAELLLAERPMLPVYACPEERARVWRRRAIALKAVATRRARRG